MRKEGVAGFMFSPGRDRVALVSKLKPDWQAGKLNGIGGKCNVGETPHESMVREFREETGIATCAADWRLFCALHHNGWVIHFFAYFPDTLHAMPPHNDIGEELLWYGVEAIPRLPTIRNLRWLVPMALDTDLVSANVIDPSRL